MGKALDALPHARGGVSQKKIGRRSRKTGLPHARGGVSSLSLPPGRGQRSSPRPWGCFSPCLAYRRRARVFPTPVGVFLIRGQKKITFKGLPHARGGVSPENPVVFCKKESSPRPWGCFHIETARSALPQLFPTPVGVVPGRAFRGEVSRTLPHARGGVSTFRSTSPALVSSSPRPWGWFRPHVRLRTAGGVFLTPMGMAPT